MYILDAIDYVKKIPGGLSVTEMLGMYDLINKTLTPEHCGIAIDLGSDGGKSACFGKYSFILNGLDRPWHLVDPVYATDTEKITLVRRHMENVGGERPTILWNMGSIEFLKKCWAANTTIIYALIDSGDHTIRLLQDEMTYLDKLVITGGLIIFHDYRNQYIAPKRVADNSVATGKWEYVPIDWDFIKKYVSENGLEEGNNSYHLYADNPTPNFIAGIRRIK